MNRTKRFASNTLVSALQQVVVMISGMIIPRIMLVTFGSEINGIATSITQVISYFTVIEMGLGGAAIFSLYKPLANNDIDGINTVVSTARLKYIQAGVIFLSLVVILAIVYPFIVETENLLKWEIALLVIVLGMAGVIEFFTLSKYRVILSADQREYVVSGASIAYTILSTVIIVVLAKLNCSILVVRAVALISVVVRTLILMIYCKKHYKYLNYKMPINNSVLNKRWDAMYLQVLGAVQGGVPIILLTVFFRDEMSLVSIFSIFNMVIAGLSGILSIFQSGLSAGFGSVIAKNEEKVLKNAYQQFEYGYYGLLNILFITALLVLMPFVKLYTSGITDANYNQPLIGLLFVINAYLYNLKTPQGMLVISAGMYKETRWQSSIQAMIIIVVGLIATPFLGIVGVLIASILSNLYRSIDLLFFVPKHITHLPVKSTLKKWGYSLLIIALSILPFIFVKYDPPTFGWWVLYAGITCVYVCFVTLTVSLAFDYKLFRAIIRRIFNK